LPALGGKSQEQHCTGDDFSNQLGFFALRDSQRQSASIYMMPRHLGNKVLLEDIG
jgi:hypothetical protein